MRTERLPFIVLAILSLFIGLAAGLQRIGWSLSIHGISSDHGAIMVGGFLGTLITLEKIIPLKKKILYVVPLISGGSVVLFFAGVPAYSLILLLLASAGLSVVFLIYWLRERSSIYIVMFSGAACWLIGNILLIQNNFYPQAVPWWMAFALLIISAERMEMMKFLPVSQTEKSVFAAILLLFIAGCAISFHGIGSYLSAIALAGAAVWLMRYDVVALTLKKSGLTRYVGVSLLSGYIALLMSGIFLPLFIDQPMGYDILIHLFFLGFVFSMIFAHGPIILPGILGISVKPYHPKLYFWLTLLHASWMGRAVADTTLHMPLRMYSGVFSAMAIVGYFLSIVVITIRSYRAKTI